MKGVMHMRMRYVNIYDLIFNGAKCCEILEDRPNDPYLLLFEDDSEYCGRGVNRLIYKSKILSSEIKRAPRGWDNTFDLEGPSVGLFEDAHKKIMHYIAAYEV